jgi:hypothetical protein
VLLSDDEPVLANDDPLHVGGVVSRAQNEASRARADAFVLVKGEWHGLNTVGVSTLAEKIDKLAALTLALVYLRNALVYRSQQGFIASDAIRPLGHGGHYLQKRIACLHAGYAHAVESDGDALGLLREMRGQVEKKWPDGVGKERVLRGIDSLVDDLGGKENYSTASRERRSEHN